MACKGPGPPQDLGCLFTVLDMGRLEPIGDVALPAVQILQAASWAPCLVVSIPKPPRHWTPEDHLEVKRAKEEKQEHTPEDLWLTGPWKTLARPCGDMETPPCTSSRSRRHACVACYFGQCR